MTGSYPLRVSVRFYDCPKCYKRLWYSMSDGTFYCPDKSCNVVLLPQEVTPIVAQNARDHFESIRLRKAIKEEEQIAARAAAKDLVYYIRFGDRIKIGTTKNLKQRMSELPWEEILLVEPGDRSVEQLRHAHFQNMRVLGEWFEYTPILKDHIERLREELKPAHELRFPDSPPFPWKRGTKIPDIAVV